MVFGEDRAVIVDVLHRGHDEGVGLEAGRIQDRDVQEVPLRQRQATENDQITGALLNLYGRNNYYKRILLNLDHASTMYT